MALSKRGVIRYRLVANFVLFIASLLLCEGMLQFVARVSPRAAELLGPPSDGFVHDAVLGIRGDPQFADHDQAGYRNRNRPQQAAVVVLGDSQTYGTSVGREDAWPRLLESLLAWPVYNMALPSYSPVHEYLQFDEAMSLRPKYIVAAVYFGNDFAEAFTMALKNPEVAAFAPRELMVSSSALEARGSLVDKIDLVFRRREPSGRVQKLWDSVRERMSLHSRLYGLARAVRNATRPSVPSSSLLASDFDTAVRGLSDTDRKYCLIVNESGWRTILTPTYRVATMDDTDVRIRLGIELVKRTLNSMAERSRHAGAKFLVVLIPTKENVFRQHVQIQDANLSRLVELETRLDSELKEYFEAMHVDFVDVGDPLRKAAQQPYFENADGHPNLSGHRIIASAVAAKLNALR